jgi:hypothetical protein
MRAMGSSADKMNLRQRWKQTALHNKLLVGIGAFAVFSTLLNIFVLVVQSRISGAQTDRLIAAGDATVRNLAQANRQQLKAAEDALKIAADNLAAQSERLRLERRAWVGVTGLRELRLEPDKPSSFTAEVRNSGATPARITSVRIQARVVAPSDKFVARYVAPVETPSTLVLQPGMTVGLPQKGRQNLTQADVRLLGDETAARAYVFGEILYRDVFDRSHFTRFCMRIEADLKTSKWCDTYNEAD